MTALSGTHAHSHSPLSRGFRGGGKWHNNAGRQGVSLAAWAMPAQQNDERNQAKTNNATQPFAAFPSLASQCLQKGLFTLARESGLFKAECKRDLQATTLSRRQQLLLKRATLPTTQTARRRCRVLPDRARCRGIPARVQSARKTSCVGSLTRPFRGPDLSLTHGLALRRQTHQELGDTVSHYRYWPQ